MAGLPKAAFVTHERVWAASFIQGVCGVTSEDIFYINLPLYHSAGFLIGMSGAIERGNDPTAPLLIPKAEIKALTWFFRYDHFPKEEVLGFSVLGRLQEVQRDSDAVHRRNPALPLQHTQGNSSSRRVLLVELCFSALTFEVTSLRRRTTKRTTEWGSLSATAFEQTFGWSFSTVLGTSRSESFTPPRKETSASSTTRPKSVRSAVSMLFTGWVASLNISIQILWIKVQVGGVSYRGQPFYSFKPCLSSLDVLSLHFDQVWHREGGARQELWGSVRWGSQRWASFPGGRIHQLRCSSFLKC